MLRSGGVFGTEAQTPRRQVAGGRKLVRVNLLLGIVVFLIVTLVQGIHLFFAYEVLRRDAVLRLESEALTAIRSNLEPTAFPNAAETLAIGERLMRHSAVRGGIVTNALGDEVAAFGARPQLAFAQAMREGSRSGPAAGGTASDLLLTAQATGLAFPIILRLDTRAAIASATQQVQSAALAALAISFGASLLASLAFTFVVVRPIVRLARAATAAADDPTRADMQRLNWTRRDELGDAGRALDLLIMGLSVVYQEDLAATREAVQRSNFANLTYDPTGRLMSANPAALKLFGVETVEDLSNLRQDYLELETENGRIQSTPLDVVTQGEFSDVVTVSTPRGDRRCHLDATTVVKKSGAVMRHTLTLSDLTKQLTYADHLKGECTRLQAARSEDRRRIAEMKGLFESCLVILSRAIGIESAPKPAAIPETAPTVVTERIVTQWFADARRNGLVQGRLEHEVLPPVRGTTETVENVFRQAMLAVHTRASTLKPGLAIDSELRGADIWFQVSEIDPGTLAERVTGTSQPPGQAAALSHMALTQALAAAGGRSAPPRASGNVVAFVLPAPISTEAAETGARTAA